MLGCLLRLIFFTAASNAIKRGKLLWLCKVARRIDRVKLQGNLVGQVTYRKRANLMQRNGINFCM